MMVMMTMLIWAISMTDDDEDDNDDEEGRKEGRKGGRRTLMMFVLIISIISIEFLTFNKFDVWNAMANFNMWFVNLGIEFLCKCSCCIFLGNIFD